ncbi:hypothetical protein ACOMHN_007466 [Nucella lapillus]
MRTDRRIIQTPYHTSKTSKKLRSTWHTTMILSNTPTAAWILSKIFKIVKTTTSIPQTVCNTASMMRTLRNIKILTQAATICQVLNIITT